MQGVSTKNGTKEKSSSKPVNPMQLSFQGSRQTNSKSRKETHPTWSVWSPVALRTQKVPRKGSRRENLRFGRTCCNSTEEFLDDFWRTLKDQIWSMVDFSLISTNRILTLPSWNKQNPRRVSRHGKSSPLFRADSGWMDRWRDAWMYWSTYACMHLCMYLSNECMYECMYMSNMHRLSIDPFSRCKLKVKIFTYNMYRQCLCVWQTLELSTSLRILPFQLTMM